MLFHYTHHNVMNVNSVVIRKQTCVNGFGEIPFLGLLRQTSVEFVL